MNKHEFTEYLNSLDVDFESTGGVTEKQIDEFEEQLGFSIPNCYRWYLKEYGSGGVGGADVLGIGLNNINTSLRLIKKTSNFPEMLIPILICDEYISCLDVSTCKDDDCMVVMWGIDDGQIDLINKGFYDYLFSEFNLMLGR